MSLLNVNLALLAYSDATATQTPNLRLADMKWSMQGLPTSNFKNIPISLSPGESMTIASTIRTLAFTAQTNFVVTKRGSDRMRITGSFGQRISRQLGDETTVWSIELSGNAVRLKYSSGATPNLSNIQIGDKIKITGAQTFNCGEFMVLSKGSDSLDFSNSYAQAESNIEAEKISVYSNGPVQKGDILDISAPQFTFVNQGSFPILEVTDSYIEVLNPNAFDQTVAGVTSGFSVYQYAYKWMMIAVDRKVRVGLNGQAPTVIEVEPAVEGDLIKQPGIFLKRGKVYEVQIMNSGLENVQGFLVLAE